MDDIAGGMQYEEVIIDAIVDSKCFILFHSENSSKSEWAKDELLFAIKEQKKILPILIDQTPITGTLNLFLALYEKFDLTKCDSMTQIAEVAQMLMRD